RGTPRHERCEPQPPPSKPARRRPDDAKHHGADEGDGRVLALEIGLCPLAHGARDLLHLLAAGGGRHDRLSGPCAVDDGKRAAGDDHPQSSHARPHFAETCPAPAGMRQPENLAGAGRNWGPYSHKGGGHATPAPRNARERGRNAAKAAKTQPSSARARRIGRVQAGRNRCRSDSQTESAAAIAMAGKTTALTALHPKDARIWPDEKEPIAMAPKTRKSLNACTLLRSSGRWHCVTMVVAATNAKFHPMPRSTRADQKCGTVVPATPIVALTAISRSPPSITRCSP